MTKTAEKIDALPEGGFDGLHHLWCKHCHPEWAASPLGVGVGNVFTAWCGVRAVILIYHLSDEIPTNPCPACVDPAKPCTICGGM